MHVGEYLLALVGIVLGLALADLGISTHRLIRRRADVKFDVMPILTAAIAAYLVFLNFWGDFARFRNLTEASLWSTLPNLLVLFLSFLIAAAALPDEWEGKLDLWEFYLHARVQFWLLVGAAGVAATLYEAAGHWPPRTDDYVSIGLTLPFAIIPCITKRHWIHVLVAVLFLIVIIAMTYDYVIRG